MGAIKKLFKSAYKDLKNKDFFSRTIIGTITLVALTLASAITTFNGMWEYTELWFVSLMTTIGVQLIMLHTAGKIIALEEIHSDRFMTLTLIYLMAMIVSSFFSFAAFYETIESDERLRSQSNLVLRTQWGNVYSEIIDTNKLELFGSYRKSGGLENWNSEYQKFVANVRRYIKDIQGVYDSRYFNINESLKIRSKRQNNKFSLLEEIEEDINRLESKSSRNSGLIAQQNSLVESLQKRFETERDEGGTPREDDTISPRGYGPIARSIELELKTAEQDLDLLKAEQAKVNAELSELKNRQKELSDDLSNVAISSEELQFLSIQGILEPYEKLKDIAQKLPTENQHDVNDFQSLNQKLLDHSRKVNLCIEVKALTSSVDLAVSKITNSGLPRVIDYNIQSNICDISPNTGGLNDFAVTVSKLGKFESKCAPEKLPAEVASFEDLNEPRESLSSEGKKITIEQKNYLEDFNKLKMHLIECMKYPPRARDNEQSAKILNDFTFLLLAYDPTAHPFTRAVEAFKRGELTAYIAAIIALIIDLLIYTFSLTLRNLPVVSNNGEDNRNEYYDHIVLLFEENPYLLGWLLDSPEYNEEKKLHIIKTTSHAYSRYREQVIYLHILNAINLDTTRGEITLDNSQYEYLIAIRHSEGLLG